MNLVQLPPNNNQTQSVFPRWILYRSACYLGGRGITFGDVIVPHLTKSQGKTSLNVDIMMSAGVDIIDTEIGMFSSEVLDHVFIGPRLEALNHPPSMVNVLAQKLRVGGHLVMCQNNMNAKAKFHWGPDGVTDMVRGAGRWIKKAEYLRDGVILQIYKKIHGKKGIDPPKPLSGKPRACICRYGALGDMIIITPLIHQLADDGFDVTMNVSPYCLPILDHNPHVKNFVIQEREMIPNPELGPYWDEWKGDYERYINLSESLEGRYLKVEGRRDFYTAKDWRVKTGEHNYYDATMSFGGYPEAIGRKGELFFSNAEERNAKKFFDQYRGKFVAIWAMNGSSHHKVYPQMALVLDTWLNAHPNTIVVTVGDGVNKQMDYEHTRLINMAGKWSIRESLIGAKYANLVLGPETMMTNAAGSMGTPVITLLSHSTHEALCKHWGSNDYCLAPENIPCYPCFQLHYTRESCPIKQIIGVENKEVLAEAPACALDGIKPERLITRMEEVYAAYYQQLAAKSGILNTDGSLGQMDAISA